MKSIYELSDGAEMADQDWTTPGFWKRSSNPGLPATAEEARGVCIESSAAAPEPHR